MKAVEDNKDLGWEWDERELLEQLFLAKEWIKRLRHCETWSKVFDIFHDGYDDESDEKKMEEDGQNKVMREKERRKKGKWRRENGRTSYSLNKLFLNLI